MTTPEPDRTPTQTTSTTTDKVVLAIGAAAVIVATTAIFVDHGQLRLAARALLYATIVVGLIAVGWAGWNVTRTDGRRTGGVFETIMVWASVLAILMPVSALILRHHEKVVNCKEVRASVRPVTHRALYPPYSKEAKKCGINNYIAHLNQLGTSAPTTNKSSHH